MKIVGGYFEAYTEVQVDDDATDDAEKKDDEKTSSSNSSDLSWLDSL